MYCKTCGELLEGHEKFCPACGAALEEEPSRQETTVLNPVHSQAEDCIHEGHVVNNRERVGFFEAFKLFFTRYADFKGRSRRSEYWFGCLSVGILSALIEGIVPDFAWVWSVVIWLPTLAIGIRRLHDIGRSGWWYLINLIPVAGQIIFLIWACQDSTEDNIWGPNPKA